MDRLEKFKMSNPYQFIRAKVIKLMYYLPVDRKKVIFDNFGGKGYGGDPKYIAEYLRKNAPHLKLFWAAADLTTELPSEIKPVKHGTIFAAYHYATSKVWVDNIKNSPKVRKKKSQFYIQTWHSTLGLKKSEAAAKNLDSTYIEAAQKDAAMTDLMYANSDLRKKIYENVYWYHGPVIKCGVPRNQLLIKKDTNVINKVYSHFNISPEKKILLYAPTFRKNARPEMFKLDYEQILRTLNEQSNHEFVCLLRLHPNDSKRCNFMKYTESVKNASSYPDMQELLSAAHILITDYSGCMFDFAISKKPVFLYVADLEKYLLEERDLYFSFSELPFSYAKTVEELLNNIFVFDNKNYIRKCDEFFSKIGMNEDGLGAETIGNIIIEKCGL